MAVTLSFAGHSRHLGCVPGLVTDALRRRGGGHHQGARRRLRPPKALRNSGRGRIRTSVRPTDRHGAEEVFQSFQSGRGLHVRHPPLLRSEDGDSCLPVESEFGV